MTNGDFCAQPDGGTNDPETMKSVLYWWTTIIDKCVF